MINAYVSTPVKITVRLLKETLLACNKFVVIKCDNNTLIYKANYSTVIMLSSNTLYDAYCHTGHSSFIIKKLPYKI